MYGHNPLLPVHLYTDVSGFAGGLVITQFRPTESKKHLEVPIVYNSSTFSITQRKYATYKRELCALIKFVIKYDYLYKYPVHTTIIHTDHKLLTRFLTSDAYEGIYSHWADRLRRFNIIIKYIPSQKKVADGLLQTLFYNEDCGTNENVEEAAKILSRKGA